MSLTRTHNKNIQSAGDYDPGLPLQHILIAVMGVTGAGKSSFIKTLTGRNVVIGHGVESCTTEVASYSFRHENFVVHLVDTPGFDDTNKSDTDILNEVSIFLASTYRNGAKLTGIIYLHRITDNRMQGSAVLNLKMFKKLCGEDCLPNVILATTMWGVSSQVRIDQEQREAEITTKPEFWGSLLRKGARSMRYEGDYKSAIGIVSRLERRPQIVLDIQRQIVDDRKTLDETPAGMFLRRDIIKKEQEYKRKLEQAREQMEEALKEKDEEFAREMRQQISAIQEKVNQAARDKINLKADLSARLDEKQKIIDEMASETARAVWRAGVVGAAGGIGTLGVAAMFAPAMFASLGAAELAAAMEFGVRVITLLLASKSN